MKVRYKRKEDILVLEVSKSAIDHAEEAGPIIAHFSEDDRLVLLEIRRPPQRRTVRKP